MGWGSIIGAAGGLIGGLLASESSRDTAQSAQYAAQLQWDIANRVQAISDELFTLWRQEFLTDERALNREVQGLTPYRVQYATAANRAIIEVRRQFGLARRRALECLDPHCVGAAVATARDLSTNEAMAAAWAASLMERGEDALKRSIDHQQRQEQLQLVQFAHKAYFSTDQTALAARIAGNLQASASASASNQAAAAGYLVTQGLNSIFGSGGLLSDKKNPSAATQVNGRGVASQPLPNNTTVVLPNQTDGTKDTDPSTGFKMPGFDLFTIGSD